MKQKLLCGLMALVLGPAALSQTPDLYENWGLVQCPPEIPPTIDASNFVNHAQFFVNFTNSLLLSLPVSTPPFETSSTLNYTNDFGAVLSCNTGFRLENYSLQSSQRQRASSLFNNGTIDCGTLGTSNTISIGGLLFNLVGTGSGVKCLVNATNIVNPGTINMGYDSLLSLQGENIDITYGTLSMENTGFNGLNGNIFFNGGFFDGYWGLSFTTTNYNFNVDPTIFESSPPYSQYFLVTNRNYNLLYTFLGGPGFVPYLLDVTDSTGSNRTVRAVFVSNTNAGIKANVYFPNFGDPYQLGPDLIGLSSVITNFQGVSTNYIYIEDTYLVNTNHQLLLNGYAGVGINRPTYIPENYTFFTGGQFFVGSPASARAIPVGTFIPGVITNQWVAYQAVFQPGSVILTDTAGQNVTNQPGRIELTADKYLALTNAQISSVNYVLLKATNHFGGSPGAQISTPYADLYLRSTNGVLDITNVLAPSLSRPIGICNLYSARWTNVVVGAATVTNRFHVFFVDVQAAPTSPLMVQTLNLTATNASTDNIYIRDVFNVMSNLLINTPRLTLTTNAPGSPAPVGVLNDLNPSILWPNATPGLQYLTNYGVIQAPNLVVFGGSQTTPYSSPASSTNPYAAFVNFGSISNFASSIFSGYFQNSGTFSASGAAIQLRQVQAAILTNGAFLAPSSAGTILIQGGSLTVSNHLLQAGNSLTLSLTTNLDDGSLSAGADAVAGKNTWYAGYGINLPTLPTNSSLLATTITNAVLSTAPVPNVWAGQDRGPVASGYNNNAALGRLILDGLTNTTKFRFQPAGTSNALYVDSLEMRDYMTNFDGSGNLLNLQFAAGMKIYYAQLIINGVSWAEKLNHKNGGGLNWVSSYAGTFSSTNMVYPDGTTNRLNVALVQSCTLDSNDNGIVNCLDPAPVLVSSQVLLAATLTNLPPRAVALTWNSYPYSTNSVFFKPSLTATNNWQLLTNAYLPINPFVLGGAGGPQRVLDPVVPGGRIYRVRVDLPSP